MRKLIILCLFITSTIFSCNKPEDSVPPMGISFVIVDSLNNPLIANKDYKIEWGDIDAMNRFTPNNGSRYIIDVADVNFKDTKYKYKVNLNGFFENYTSILYLRSDNNYVDKLRVEVENSNTIRVFLNEIEVKKIEKYPNFENLYVFVRKTGK